ncbi:MAG TPA: hypothetical protein PKD86_07360 [Gemmatales bacterium]|nr:hypothetical protein [Gemmatales bacterium]HMP59153.1 hypothetical protein [Gemmatales bacterium]
MTMPPRALLLGRHPDAVFLAVALAESGLLELAAYVGPPNEAERWQGRGWSVTLHRDLETALALPGIDWIIAGDDLTHRPVSLRRALQSERHVFLAHPADLEPDICYEALHILGDTRKRLAPLLPQRTTGVFRQLGQFLQGTELGLVQRVEMEIAFAPPPDWESHPLMDLWHWLRLAGGEIAELTALTAEAEEATPVGVLTLSGRFQAGAFFQVVLTPTPQSPAGSERVRLTLRGERGLCTLDLPAGWYGPGSFLASSGAASERREEWPATSRPDALLQLARETLAGQGPVTWTDATRCLELFSAVRRSVRRRRIVVLEYESFGEVGNFKSAMTALGCGVLLLIMILFFATPTVPWLKWLIVPLLLLFLGLQGLRWLARDEPEVSSASAQGSDEGSAEGGAKASV